MSREQKLKYPKELYEDTEFFGQDQDSEVEDSKQKIVKTRSEHKCAECEKTIPERSFALRETCFWDGPKSAYLCIACCEKWMDEVYQYDDEVQAQIRQEGR